MLRRQSRQVELRSVAATLLATLLMLIVSSNYVSAQTTSPKPSAIKSTPTLALHLDAAQTKIEWTVDSLLHDVHGTVKINGGVLIADPVSGVAQGEIEIDAASMTTGDAKRDAKWQKDVLDSALYPAIIFHPTQVTGLKEGDGEQTLQAKGTITLHGSDHPLELTLHLVATGKQATVTTHFLIPYMQWGLKNPSSGLTHYGKEIAVDVTAKGTLEHQTAVPDAPQTGNSR